ncbi:Frigida-like [Sesbania bispinosa]|nr:Frigida-like [Sesbania bispinosa]
MGCTLLWKELSDHFSFLEQDLRNKSEALNQTNESLNLLDRRETSIDDSVQIALRNLDQRKEAALSALLHKLSDDADTADADDEVDNGEGLMLKLKSFCLRMDALGFWGFVVGKKKELEESLIPVMVDSVIGKSRMLVTPSVKEWAKDIAETWKASLEERGGIENVKTPDVHTFLQHLVTFGIVNDDDLHLYRKLVIASSWRKHMPKLALSLGLAHQMHGNSYYSLLLLCLNLLKVNHSFLVLLTT